jgi:formate C-acetyltransferase
VLINDEIAIPAIMAQGKSLEEAREYVLIGCYEPTIEGREISCNMAIHVNLAKSVELTLSRGVDAESGERVGPDTGEPLSFATYEQFEDAYFKQLYSQVDNVTGAIRTYEPYWAEINPSPVLAGTFVDALKSGLDIGQSGPKYNNTGCLGIGLGSAVDALSAVKSAVYNERVCTMEELITAVNDNFEGHGKLRQYLQHRAPKWGNGNPEADEQGKKITKLYSNHVNAIRNNRGGRFMPSLFSLDHRQVLGERTAALPSGRKKGEALSLNNAASTGMDKEGVTAMLKSLTCIDYIGFPNGSVTDVYLHPSAVEGDDGLKAFISLIKTYFSLGGFGIQFNIFDTQTLLDAQKHPENYKNLQVRVCGWNVYFINLSPKEQELYININKHAV